MWPWSVDHIQREEPTQVMVWRSACSALGWQEQTRSCAQELARADAPVLGGGSIPDFETHCQHSCPQAEWLHQRSGSVSLSSSKSAGSKAESPWRSSSR